MLLLLPAGKVAAGAGAVKLVLQPTQPSQSPAMQLLLPAGKGAAAAAVKLVPQPVNKKVLVPPPTEDEKGRNVSAVSFAVERIMGHKVCVGVCKRGGYSVCVCGGGGRVGVA